MSEVVEDEREETFWDHLYELLNRLRRVLIAWFLLFGLFLIAPASPDDLIKFIVGGIYQPMSIKLLNVLKEFIFQATGYEDIRLIGGDFSAPIELYLQASIVMATGTVIPYLAYEIYMFMAPGLYEHEKRFFKTFMLGFSLAFLFGALYGLILIVPITFRILVIFTDVFGFERIFNAYSFFNLVFFAMVASGFIFTLPVFLTLAFKFGVLDPDQVAGVRRYIYVAVFFIAAVLTADPTPVSMTLLSLPFILFMEISIYIGRRIKPG